MRYFLQTFGCQMNYSDSERVHAVMDALGFEKTDKVDQADLIILNTCSVKQQAEDKVVGIIRNYNKLKKKNLNLRIGITGCMVRKTGINKNLQDSDISSDDKLFKWIKNLDFVFRIENTGQLRNIMNKLFDQDFSGDYLDEYANYFEINPKYTSQIQAFVPIMTGCNNFCSYCIVPYTRGREICRSLSEILKEIKFLVQKGLKEVTLLGQNVNSYVLDDESIKKFQFERDLGKSDFVILLQEINKISGLKRIRYTSSHPKDFGDDLIEAHATLKNLCRHVHLAVQSGDDQVLKRMNRHYTANHFRELIRKLREKVPEVAVTTDIIVGFCGETEDEFRNTEQLIQDIGFDMMYMSQYSTRKGTLADKNMQDDISHDIKTSRWNKVNELLKKNSLNINSKYMGQTVQVLVEEEKKDYYWGKTDNFKTVRFQSDQDRVGELVTVKIKQTDIWVLTGEEV